MKHYYQGVFKWEDLCKHSGREIFNEARCFGGALQQEGGGLFLCDGEGNMDSVNRGDEIKLAHANKYMRFLVV